MMNPVEIGRHDDVTQGAIEPPGDSDVRMREQRDSHIEQFVEEQDPRQQSQENNDGADR